MSAICSGWQERWFVLDNGNLSYYKSQDDVNTGCKGSVKMSVCDIVVHTTDPVRLDLIIPGEQHFYVRALNPKERQQWLVALGTSKASMGKLHVEPENASNDMLKTKRSELRLYCDLLMQQIHSVKMTVQETDIPDVEKLNQASSLISPTCDTFIRTLEECMKIVQTSMPFEGQHPVITDAALPTSPQKSNKKSRHAHRQNSYERSLSHQHSRSPSVSSLDTNPPSRQNSKTKTMPDTSISDLSLSEHKVQEHSLLVESMRTTNVIGTSKQNVSIGNVKSDLMDLEQKHGHRISCSSETGAMLNSNSAHIENFNNSCRTSHSSLNIENTGYKINSTQLLKTSSDEKLQCDGDVFLDPIEPRVPTFFSEMNPSFMDLKIQEDAGIAVEPFLDACRCLVPIFDKLSSTAFAPVKMDFQGNIRKVKTKYSLHPEQFKTLQSIILHEKGAKQHHLTNSATMALLWLKRSLEFISGFMEEIRKGEDNLGVAASNAYLHSLKPYHGWVVRGVFAVAVKALPYRDVFMTLLNPNAEGNLDEQLFQTCVLQDLESFNIALEVVIKILSDFYKQHDLDSDEQI